MFKKDKEKKRAGTIYYFESLTLLFLGTVRLSVTGVIYFAIYKILILTCFLSVLAKETILNNFRFGSVFHNIMVWKSK
jgi:hypothetical protein